MQNVAPMRVRIAAIGASEDAILNAVLRAASRAGMRHRVLPVVDGGPDGVPMRAGSVVEAEGGGVSAVIRVIQDMVEITTRGDWPRSAEIALWLAELLEGALWESGITAVGLPSQHD